MGTCQQTRLRNWYPFEGSVRWGIRDGMWGYKVSEQEVGTKEGFPSNHRQQEVTNNLLMEMTDVQNNAVEPWLEELHGLSDQDDLEPFQDWEGQEKGEVLGMGSKVEQITRVKGRLEQKLQFWKENLQVSLFVIGCIEEGYI